MANKFAKFHAKILNRSENIPKSFTGATFLKHPVHTYINTVYGVVVGAVLDVLLFLGSFSSLCVHVFVLFLLLAANTGVISG